MFEHRSNIKLQRRGMKGEIVFQNTSNNSLPHVVGYGVPKAVLENHLGSFCMQRVCPHTQSIASHSETFQNTILKSLVEQLV